MYSGIRALYIIWFEELPGYNPGVYYDLFSVYNNLSLTKNTLFAFLQRITWFSG